MPLSKILWLRDLARRLLQPETSPPARKPSPLDLEELEPRNAPALMAAPIVVSQHTAIVTISNPVNSGVKVAIGGTSEAILSPVGKGTVAIPQVVNGGTAGTVVPGVKVSPFTGLGMFLTPGTLALPKPSTGTTNPSAGSSSSASTGSTGGTGSTNGSTGTGGTASAGSTGSSGSSGGTVTASGQSGTGATPPPGGLYLGAPSVILPGLAPPTNPANPGSPPVGSVGQPPTQPPTHIIAFSAAGGIGKGGLSLVTGILTLPKTPTGVTPTNPAASSSSAAGTGSSSASSSSSGSTANTAGSSGSSGISSAGSTGSAMAGSAGGPIQFSGVQPGVGLFLNASAVALPSPAPSSNPVQASSSAPNVNSPVPNGLPTDPVANVANIEPAGIVQADLGVVPAAPLTPTQPPDSTPTAPTEAGPASGTVVTGESTTEIVVQQPTSDSNALLVEPTSVSGPTGGSTIAVDSHGADATTASATIKVEYNPTGSNDSHLLTTDANGDGNTSPGTADFDLSGGIVAAPSTVD